jgi:hypothetical protein
LKYVILGNVIWKVSFLTGFHLNNCGQELNIRDTRINQASGEIIIIIVIIIIIIITYQQHDTIDNMLALPDAQLEDFFSQYILPGCISFVYDDSMERSCSW